MAITVTGSEIPIGREIVWYCGGVEALITTETLTEDAGIITLTKKAEYGCILARTAADANTEQMLELSEIAPSDVDASDTTGTSYVRTSAGGTAEITVYYVDIETTALAQIIAAKDVSSPFSIDVKETELAGQLTKARKTGAAARTFTIEQVDYNMTFMGAIFGDLIENSPAAGMFKFTDKFSSTKKLSFVVGKQTISGTLTKKWFYVGLEVTKIDNSQPCADWWARSMDFIVDYYVETDVVPN